MALKIDGEKLVKPNEIRKYTPEQIAELQKCSEDVFYFAQKYVKVLHPVLGFIKLDPYYYQLEFLKMLQEDRFVIGMWGRQSGKSTIVATYAVWYAIFNDHRTIAIVANKIPSGKNLLRRMRYIYRGLPGFLKPGLIEWAKLGVEFDNGTNILVGATTEDSLSGESVSVLICDEFAKVNPRLADEFWAANYPTISTGGQVIVISTPKGIGNLFHRTWVKAERNENEFKHYKVLWDQVPGRDEEWKKQEIVNLGSTRLFSQEHELNFLGAVDTLVNTETLQRIAVSYIDPIEEVEDGHGFIYDYPKAGHTYVAGIDSGQGLGQNDSVVQIFDVTDYPKIMPQVFVYYYNEISIYDFPAIIVKWAEYYNEAWLMVENNAEAFAVVKDIWQVYEYPRLCNLKEEKKTKKMVLGIKATPATKPRANQWLKKLLEDEVMVLKDQRTITELCAYISKGKKYFGEGMEDDCVTGCVWAGYFLKTKYYDVKDIAKEKNEGYTYREELKERKDYEADGWGFDYEDHHPTILDEMIGFQRELMKKDSKFPSRPVTYKKDAW